MTCMHPPSLRFLHRLARLAGAVLASACLWFPHAAAVPLPLAMNLESGPLTLVLWSADVSVRVDPEAVPSLVARWQPEAAGGEELDLVLEEGATRLGRPASEPPGPGKPRRLRVEVVVRPGQQVEIQGSGLTVTADGSAAAPSRRNALDQADPSSQAVALALAVEGSQVSVARIEGVQAQARGGWMRLDAVSGTLVLGVEGGGLEVHGHAGVMQLTGQGAELAVADLNGTLLASLLGGTLDVADGTGSVTLQLREGGARIGGWQGPVSIDAQNGGVEVRSSGSPDGEIELVGKEVEAVLDDLRGTVTARLEGGSLTASGLDGEANLQARADTQVTIAGFRGAAALTLHAGSTGIVKDFAGQLRADVSESRLTIDQVGRLELTAQRAEVTATGVGALGRVEATDGRLELDLTAMRTDARLVLRGSTEARARLSTPCIVRALGAVTFDGSQLEVTGCDQNASGQGARTAALRRQYGGQAMVLTASLDATARLEVEGE